MGITQTIADPSRPDATRLNRKEKMAMIVLAYAATILDDLQTDLADRIQMIDGGAEKLHDLSVKTDELLSELRLTVPVNQRMNLQNTATDFEIRLAPKATPSKTSVVLQKEEFKELVDFARAECRDCMDDDKTCEKCKLYQLLTVILPLDEYNGGMLCPYNLGEWAN